MTRINALLNDLPPRERQAIGLAWIHGLTNEQIAVTLDTTPELVEKLLRRGERLLPKWLTNEKAPPSA